jgi:hypothetical protein
MEVTQLCGCGPRVCQIMSAELDVAAELPERATPCLCEFDCPFCGVQKIRQPMNFTRRYRERLLRGEVLRFEPCRHFTQPRNARAKELY